MSLHVEQACMCIEADDPIDTWYMRQISIREKPYLVDGDLMELVN